MSSVLGIGVNHSDSSSQQNQYGSKTPIISPQYNDAFNSYAKSLGFDPSQWMNSAMQSAQSGGQTSAIPAFQQTSRAGMPPPIASNQSGAMPPSTSSYDGSSVQSSPTLGANGIQSNAINWQTNNLLNSPADAAAKNANDLMSWGGRQYGFQDVPDSLNGRLSAMSQQSAPKAMAASAEGAQSAGTGSVNAQTGAQAAAQYAALYGQNLIDPSLRAYDYGTDRAFSALDARTAGAGAFGNDRNGLGYSDLGAQSALGRGQLESGLLTSGLNNAINAGQTDASRGLTAQTTNASNTLNNNQYNANLLQNNNQYNAGLLQQTNLANLAAQQTNTGQKLQAAQQISSNIAAQTGLSQQIMNNIITANGVNTQAAQSLFQSGTITQAQLSSILDAAAQFNGSSFTQNTDTTGSSTGVSVGVGGKSG